MRTTGNPKIAYIVSMVNGLEPFIYREVEALYDKGLRLALFSTKFRRNDIYSPKPEWEHYHFSTAVVLMSFPFLFLRSPMKNIGILLEAIRYSSVPEFVIALYYSHIMRLLGIGKIHCHFGDRKLFIGYFCKKILGPVPLSVTIHAHEFVTNPNEKMFRNVITQCDNVIAVSERNRAILTEDYSVPGDRVRVVRLFIDPERFGKGKRKKILWVGRFVREKRFDVLLEAMRLLDRDDTQLIIVGFGPEDPRRIAKEKGILDRVLVFDKMSEQQLRFFYESCDILCLSSEREGIPVVLMEAMASRLPVVSTDVGAVNELVKEGLLVRPENPAELAKALNTLLDDAAMRRAMGERNRRIVEELYGKRNLDMLYETLTGK